jgi:hypothetical protein
LSIRVSAHASRLSTAAREVYLGIRKDRFCRIQTKGSPISPNAFNRTATAKQTNAALMKMRR